MPYWIMNPRLSIFPGMGRGKLVLCWRMKFALFLIYRLYYGFLGQPKDSMPLT